MAPSPLASAAAGATNPFGLPGVGGAATSGLGGAQGYQLLNPPVKAAQSKPPTQTPVIPLPITAQTTPTAASATGSSMTDIATDPAIQQVNALVGLSDQQAQAQALKERQQLLLAYGDPTLAASVLGAGDPTVQAAAQNQESQLHQLDRQNMANLNDFNSQLDPSLAYSGYKVGQEQQIGQNYQDALAQAAAGAQSGLDQITSNLNATLEQNAMQEEMAYLEFLLSGGGGGGSTPPASSPPPQGPPPITNYATAQANGYTQSPGFLARAGIIPFGS